MQIAPEKQAELPAEKRTTVALPGDDDHRRCACPQGGFISRTGQNT